MASRQVGTYLKLTMWRVSLLFVISFLDKTTLVDSYQLGRVDPVKGGLWELCCTVGLVWPGQTRTKRTYASPVTGWLVGWTVGWLPVLLSKSLKDNDRPCR
ncbi:hypothetical protein BJ166DRAFT_503481 [Pestalotiopsis sp. NC0098]|nr:hypothetical protein BJ166DRAFT_503481 [Pestalotiopsis sp. NC0098]